MHGLLWHDLVQDLAHSLAGLGACGVAVGRLLHLLSHLLLHLHMEVVQDGSRRTSSVEAICASAAAVIGWQNLPSYNAVCIRWAGAGQYWAVHGAQLQQLQL